MGNLAEYFAKNRYQSKYQIGDRVFGYFNKIPFVGTVGNDRVVSEEQGPHLTVRLDLPLKHKDKVYTLLLDVKHRDVKPYR